MKSKYKAPGTKRLKLRYDHLLSIFAFNSILRRYIMVSLPGLLTGARMAEHEGPVAPVRAGSEVVEARERYAQEQRAAVIKKRDSTGCRD